MASSPRKRDADASRLEILATATRHFADKGFDGARIDEIAESAHINKRMLYVYFGNKEELYCAVLRTHFDRLLELGLNTLRAVDGPRQQAELAIRRYFQFLADNPDFVRLMSWEILAGASRARSFLVERYSAGLEQLHDIVRAGVRSGDFRADLDPRRVIINIDSLCIGYFARKPLIDAFWQVAATDPATLATTLDDIIALVLDGLAGRRDTTGDRP
jgi:TetR/AcrR family transcriptional regulator